MNTTRMARGLALLLLAGAAAYGCGRGQTAADEAGALRQTAYLKASNARMGAQFGSGGALLGDSVSLSRDGTTLAVGSPMETSAARGVNSDQRDESAYAAGAAYVFTRNGNAWTQQAYLKASNTRSNARFGYVTRLSGDGNTLAVSAYSEASAAKGINGDQNDDSIPQAGAVYIFTRSGTTWTQQAYIKASNTGEAGVGDELGDGDQFGFSLAISDDGNTLAVGAIAEDSASGGVNGNQADNSAGQAGAVYVFTRSDNTWAQQAYLKAPNPRAGDLFGYALALSTNGNVLAVGAQDEDVVPDWAPEGRNFGGTGGVYVFEREGTAWRQTGYLKQTNSDQGDALGVSVAISLDGNTIAAGVLDEDCLCTGVNPRNPDGSLAGLGDRESDTSAGAVVVWVREGGRWTEQAYIKASNTGVNDWFGARLALSGDGNILAVGAQLEDSAAQGVNGDQANDNAEDAGAVYVFTRSGGTWTQRHYVKGANTEAFDEFGATVALSADGRILAVGAMNEASAATGVNGDASDNSAPQAGAVYVFAY